MHFNAFTTSWGANFIAAGTVHFRVWAPGQAKLTLRLSGKDTEMSAAEDGWFEQVATGVSAGVAYQFILPDGMAVPDPASRAQQAGVNGPSLVTSSESYQWHNADWKGRPWEESVIYELHVGTFTPQGTFAAAMEKLPYLAETGITMIEVLPLAQFGGQRGWGYDGVLLYAPHSAYGTPDDFKAFVVAADCRPNNGNRLSKAHGVMVAMVKGEGDNTRSVRMTVMIVLLNENAGHRDGSATQVQD